MQVMKVFAMWSIVVLALPILWDVEQRVGSAQDPFAAPRSEMVTQIAAWGVRDARVLDALRQVPRHLFVPPPEQAHAYEDHPIPIGHDQTISEPYIVALMT